MSAPTVLPLQPVRMADSFSSLPYPRFQGRGGKRGRGKVVSWPPEDQICQVRFFLSNDVPSALGPVQTIFQSNPQRNFFMGSGHLDQLLDIPPGFQCSFAKRAKINTAVEVSMSVSTSWVCPQKLIRNSEWLVADGDESKEVTLQKQRELRVLEAFYPRLTSVPDSSVEPAESSNCLDDNVIPVIPLVSMEDEDETSEGPEHCVREESDVVVAEFGKLQAEQKPQPPMFGCVTRPQDASDCAKESTLCKADPQAMAAAAAAAACMAMQKFGAKGVVDQELLVEILRNPAFLENLSVLNASREDLAGPIRGKEVGNAGHSSRDPHNINQCGGPLHKAPFNTGLPSPVSVLSNWSQEHSTNYILSTFSNPSDSSDASNAKNVSSSMPTSVPSHKSYPLRENPMRMESVTAPLQGMHVFTQESGVGMKVSHASNSACVQSASVMHVDRSCGMHVDRSFPSQNAANFHSSSLGRMQSAHVIPPQACGKYAAAPCRSSFSDARLRGLPNENSGLGSMSKTGLKTPRICMYFNSPRGCRNGGNCAFLHQSLNQELNPQV